MEDEDELEQELRDALWPEDEDEEEDEDDEEA